MSKVFNMVGGGGGPAASIFVTGLSETDTVTATKGAKTLAGKWSATLNCHIIAPIRELGTWTVTATDGEQTANQDVLVDVITEYEIEMFYSKLWLYRYGDQCEDVTGGWYKNTNASIGSYASSAGTVTFEAEFIFLSSPDFKSAVATTINPISVDVYSKLKVQFGTMSHSGQNVFINNSNSGDVENCISKIVGQSSNTELELDISSLTGSYYFSCANCNGRTCQYKAIWLEV